MIRTIRRATADKARTRNKPRVGDKVGKPATIEDLFALRAGWVKISATCERCLAVHVHCLNSDVSDGDTGLCSDGPGCSWRPAAVIFDVGQRPWLADMPGTFGPGDEFETDERSRVFVGGRREKAEWKTVPVPGRYVVTDGGSLRRLQPGEAHAENRDDRSRGPRPV